MKTLTVWMLLCTMSGQIFGASEETSNDRYKFNLSCGSSEPDHVLKSKRIDLFWVCTDTNFTFKFREAYFGTRSVNGLRKQPESNPDEMLSDYWGKIAFDGYMKTGYPVFVMGIKSNYRLLLKFFILSNPKDSNWPDLDSAHIHTMYDPVEDVLDAEITWKDATKQKLEVTAYTCQW